MTNDSRVIKRGAGFVGLVQMLLVPVKRGLSTCGMLTAKWGAGCLVIVSSLTVFWWAYIGRC